MKLFLDTSLLLKLYHKEDGSEKLIEKVLAAEAVYLATLAKLEFRSALWRKIRMSEITEDECIAVIQIFLQDEHKYCWVLQDQRINQVTQELLMKWGEEGLRTLDSIQLASAITLKDQPDCFFGTADTVLSKLFQNENLSYF